MSLAKNSIALLFVFPLFEKYFNKLKKKSLNFFHTFPITFGVVDFNFFAKKRRHVKRIEGVLGLVVVLKLNEAVTLGQTCVIVQRYHYVDYIPESAKFVFQILLTL